METILFIIIGFLFLQFDLVLLKKRAEGLFDLAFYFSRRETTFFCILLFLTAFFVKSIGQDILQITAVLIGAIYLVRRRTFWQMVKNSPEQDSFSDENLALALSTFSILVKWFIGISAIECVVTIVQEILKKPHDDLGTMILLAEISSIFFIFLIYRVVSKYKNISFSQVMGLETKGLGFVKIWLIPGIVAALYAWLTSMLLDSRPVQPITPLQELINSTSSWQVILLFAATAVLTAPFFEEIIFRGFFFQMIRPYMGTVFTVVFVALTFGILHVDQYWGDWAAIAVVGCFGLVLTLLRAWTGSAIPGMVAHYVYNGCLTLVPILMVVFSNPAYIDYELNSYRLNNQQKEERLLQSIAKYPKFSNAYNDLAWIYSEEGANLDKALILIEEALKLEPDEYAYLDTKAEVLFKMGRITEAIQIEEDLLRKYPKESYIKEQIARFKKALSNNSISTEIVE